MSRLTETELSCCMAALLNSGGMWDLCDGPAEATAHECIDHQSNDSARSGGRIVPLTRYDGNPGPREISPWSSRFVRWLQARGVRLGERIANITWPTAPTRNGGGEV
jgi:acetyl-CoA synthetase